MRPCEWCGADLSIGSGSHGTMRSKKLGRWLCFEVDREDDGRWIAESCDVPGAIAYGTCEPEAVSNAFDIAVATLSAVAVEV